MLCLASLIKGQVLEGIAFCLGRDPEQGTHSPICTSGNIKRILNPLFFSLFLFLSFSLYICLSVCLSVCLSFSPSWYFHPFSPFFPYVFLLSFSLSLLPAPTCNPRPISVTRPLPTTADIILLISHFLESILVFAILWPPSLPSLPPPLFLVDSATIFFPPSACHHFRLVLDWLFCCVCFVWLTVELDFSKLRTAVCDGRKSSFDYLVDGLLGTFLSGNWLWNRFLHLMYWITGIRGHFQIRLISWFSCTNISFLVVFLFYDLDFFLAFFRLLFLLGVEVTELLVTPCTY